MTTERTQSTTINASKQNQSKINTPTPKRRPENVIREEWENTQKEITIARKNYTQH